MMIPASRALIVVPPLPPKPTPSKRRLKRSVKLALVIGTTLVSVLACVAVPTTIATRGGLLALFAANARQAPLPTIAIPAAQIGDLHPMTSSPQAFLCAALPWARLEQTFQAVPYLAVPGPHPYRDLIRIRPLAHPWYVSVLLAQWAVEHGWNIPDYTGWNWGNSSGMPGYPSVGGTAAQGSPSSFAYATDAEMGIEIHETFTRMDFYAGVDAAYPSGPQAQAIALGQSPWDAAHYTSTGSPGSALLAVMADAQTTRFDNPTATC